MSPQNPLRTCAELHATGRSEENPEPASRVLSDVSVLLPLTPLELSDGEALARRAEVLFVSGVFDTRSEAQQFTDLLVRRSRGERLAQSLEKYLAEVELTIAQLAKAENLRLAAFAEQKRKDAAAHEVHELQRELGGRNTQLAALKSFAAEMRPGAAAHAHAEIPWLIEMGQQRLGTLEAIRVLEEQEVPALEAQLAAANARLAALAGKAVG